MAEVGPDLRYETTPGEPFASSSWRILTKVLLLLLGFFALLSLLLLVLDWLEPGTDRPHHPRCADSQASGDNAADRRR